MVRVKRGNVARNRHKKILKFAKGFRGAHSRLFRTANQQVMKSLVYSYIGRKRRKRVFKKLWLCRVNAAARLEGMTYSKLKGCLKNNSIELNLKMLAQLALLDKQTFSAIVAQL
jgi:large subunit ribosomal protein L20